ncbi:carboxymuconolactone decarboxylase family protein [Pseudomaricurvus alkylphenolicus]|uniref:carboxymuconolactone decarboxylase family protein n=1 Tax=Pseudomaricurvus alkylphenolicus TaxID=1306991 RepID=UPI00141F4B36|nr:carboxymuconolactone decarboxylase family protein [Pseudomaricurvus alkylphenolicus]NIB42411.1 carboxymuconolactone decarboxylase family protein [Pseudomaricurvus alkylphenolicus]
MDKDSPLSIHEREIVILRVTANKNCEYESGVHVSVFLGAAGFCKEQIAATRLESSRAVSWNEQDTVLIECVYDNQFAAPVFPSGGVASGL